MVGKLIRSKMLYYMLLLSNNNVTPIIDLTGKQYKCITADWMTKVTAYC